MTSRERYSQTMEPVVVECQRVYGFQAEIHRQFNLLIRPEEPVARQELYMWLHSNRRKRVEPSAGTFLFLVAAIKKARTVLVRRRVW